MSLATSTARSVAVRPAIDPSVTPLGAVSAPNGVPVLRSAAQARVAAQRLAAAWAPGAVEREASEAGLWAELNELSASGLLGLSVPAHDGGLGADSATLSEVLITLASADSALAEVLNAHWTALAQVRSGASVHAQAHVHRLAFEGWRWGWGRSPSPSALTGTTNPTGHSVSETEPHPAWRLRPADPGYQRLDGPAHPVQAAGFAQWLLLWVRDDGGGSQWVLLPRESEGLVLEAIEPAFGQRQTGLASVALQGVRVPDEWVLSVPSAEGPVAWQAQQRLGQAAIDLGLGQAALAATLDFVRERARPWIDARVARAQDDPLSIHTVGSTAVGLRAAKALLHRAQRHLDAAWAHPDVHTLAKAWVSAQQARAQASTAALEAATRLLELGGSGATLDGLGLDRFWRALRVNALRQSPQATLSAVGVYHLQHRLPSDLIWA